MHLKKCMAEFKAINAPHLLVLNVAKSIDCNRMGRAGCNKCGWKVGNVRGSVWVGMSLCAFICVRVHIFLHTAVCAVDGTELKTHWNSKLWQFTRPFCSIERTTKHNMYEMAGNGNGLKPKKIIMAFPLIGLGSSLFPFHDELHVALGV